ncbi:MAG: hypothetical protein KIS87_10480 [Phycisphaeraceae bacterium]|nr:hypothetical protein [Phycisphaeraceae bacterium]
MPTTREPECIRIKREAQERLDRETADMTPRQRDAHINCLAEQLAARLGFHQTSRPIGRGPDIDADRARQAG